MGERGEGGGGWTSKHSQTRSLPVGRLNNIWLSSLYVGKGLGCRQHEEHVYTPP